jgi:hypothetical protein
MSTEPCVLVYQGSLVYQKKGTSIAFTVFPCSENFPAPFKKYLVISMYFPLGTSWAGQKSKQIMDFPIIFLISLFLINTSLAQHHDNIYNEELVIKELGRNFVNSYFQFTTRWNYKKENCEFFIENFIVFIDWIFFLLF